MTVSEMYHEMVLNALRYFGMSDMQQIEDMYLDEYILRSEAAQLRRLDHDRSLYVQAWANQAAKATKGSKGKSKYRNFDDFFGSDYKKAELEILAENNAGYSREKVIKRNRNRELQKRFQYAMDKLEKGEAIE